MKFPNPVTWIRKLYPKVRATLSDENIEKWCDMADDKFPNAANGIKRGKEKLKWVRGKLEAFYNSIDGWGPAFDLIWPIAAAAIERYLASRKK